jgi:hypothetical protein
VAGEAGGSFQYACGLLETTVGADVEVDVDGPYPVGRISGHIIDRVVLLRAGLQPRFVRQDWVRRSGA